MHIDELAYVPVAAAAADSRACLAGHGVPCLVRLLGMNLVCPLARVRARGDLTLGGNHFFIHSLLFLLFLLWSTDSVDRWNGFRRPCGTDSVDRVERIP